jgi:HK97 family phage prohead protease
MQDFQFYLPLEKSSDTQLTGIASTISVDRDGERMSENALNDMVREIMEKGVNLFGNHEHSWENTLGAVWKARLQNRNIIVDINLDDPNTNPKIPMLLNKLKRGIKMGLSVGGSVTKEREEYSKELGRRIKVIDGVNLFEISVVGIPSNADSFLSLPQAITKGYRKVEKCEQCFAPIPLNNNICNLCHWRNHA